MLCSPEQGFFFSCTFRPAQVGPHRSLRRLSAGKRHDPASAPSVLDPVPAETGMQTAEFNAKTAARPTQLLCFQSIAISTLFPTHTAKKQPKCPVSHT